MGQDQFQYWQPGKSVRALRLFFSHRYGEDAGLYQDVVDHLRKTGHYVEDVALTETQQVRGPRGGQVGEFKISKEIAARIYTADVLIAPSTKMVSDNDWIGWEVELASVCYDIPVLFIDKDDDVERRTRLVREVRDAGGRCDTAEAKPLKIAFALTMLVNTSPHKAVLFDAPDRDRVTYRGPMKSALEDVMRRFPYRGRG